MIKRTKRGANAPSLDALRKNVALLSTTNSLNSSGKLIDVSFVPSVGISARKLEQLGIDIRSFREPLKKSVKEVMVPSIRKNFDSGGRPPWEMLAESTVLTKRIKGFSAGPLIRTGMLRKVATQINIWTITEETAMVKALPASTPYGYIHQAGASKSGRQDTSGGPKLSIADMRRRATGGSQARRKRTAAPVSSGGSGAIPARPFIRLQPEDRKDIEQIFLKWFEERVARQWG